MTSRRMVVGLMVALMLATSTGRATHSGDERLFINTRDFKIPLNVEPHRKAEIRELVLYVSRDEGERWERVRSIPPAEYSFPFVAPEDGRYWFAVQTVYKNGKRDPSSLSASSATLKIVIDTIKPEITLSGERAGDCIVVHWRVMDDNPAKTTLRLDYQTSEMATPTPAVFKPSPSGTVEIPCRSPYQVRVEMTLKDLAGNMGKAELWIPATKEEQIAAKATEDTHPAPHGKKKTTDFRKEVEGEMAALLVKKYLQACREGLLDEARRLVRQAVKLDPACFARLSEDSHRSVASRCSSENGVLAGEVVNKTSNRRLTNASIQVIDLEDLHASTATLTVETDPQGYFVIRGLQEGKRYQLIARVKEKGRDLAGAELFSPPNTKVRIVVEEDPSPGSLLR